jgi:hypothetical protein
MAYRYRQRIFESGDFLTPPDWNENLAELVGEFNGALDRDNVPESAITEPLVVNQAFNIEQRDGYDGSEPAVISGDNMGWQDGDDSFDIGVKVIDIQVDGVAVVEWSGWWFWDDGLYPTTLADDIAIKFQITVDGVSVAESGFSSANRFYDSTYIVGVIPVQAGRRTFRVQAMNADITDAAPAFTSLINCTVMARELDVLVRLR